MIFVKLLVRHGPILVLQCFKQIKVMGSGGLVLIKFSIHDIDCAVAVVENLCNICDNKRDLRNSNDLCKAISAARADSKSSTFQAETYKGFMIKMPKQNQWKNTS